MAKVRRGAVLMGNLVQEPNAGRNRHLEDTTMVAEALERYIEGGNQVRLDQTKYAF